MSEIGDVPHRLENVGLGFGKKALRLWGLRIPRRRLKSRWRVQGLRLRLECLEVRT